MTMKNKDYHTNIKQIAHQSWCYKERGKRDKEIQKGYKN